MITESIDLTLDALFAGDTDKSLLPDPARARTLDASDYVLAKKNIFSNDPPLQLWALQFITMHGKELNGSHLLNTIVTQDILDEYLQCYYKLFDNMPPHPTDRLDPMYAYFESSGVQCDGCGTPLDFFNRGLGFSICTKCTIQVNNRSREFQL